MKYAEIQSLSDAKFKRLTGVPHLIFQQIVAVLEERMPTFGRPPKLSRADQLLLTENTVPSFISAKLTELASQPSAGQSGKLKTC